MSRNFILKIGYHSKGIGPVLALISGKLRDLNIRIIKYNQRTWRIESIYNETELREAFNPIAEKYNVEIEIKQLP